MEDIESLFKMFSFAKESLSFMNQAKKLLPDTAKKNEAAKKLEEAEKALKIAEVEAAKNLGYNICQCTFPPQIMLFLKDKNVYRCTECGHELVDPGIESFPSESQPEW